MGKLIEKEGRFYKECRVVMLDTDTPSKLGFLTQKGKDVFNDLQWFKGHELPNILDSVNQHLYITSDDEIKDGDWYYDSFLKEIDRAGDTFAHKCGEQLLNYDNEYVRKIIATTDSSLCTLEECPVRGAGSSVKYILPQPSDKFIQAYIEAYNKGEKIEKVLVEYNNWKFPHGLEEELKLKDNNIIIKKVKDSWTREEVRSLFNKYVNDMRSNSEFFRKHEDMPGGIPALRDIWMEENL